MPDLSPAELLAYREKMQARGERADDYGDDEIAAWAAEESARKAARPYRPSNGTEGDSFMGAWCERCTRYRKGACGILNASFVYSLGEPGYPQEWRRVGPHGRPVCTAYRDPDDRPPPRPRNRVRPAEGQAGLFEEVPRA